MTTKNWIDYRHPQYDANLGRWLYARDHYTGNVLAEDKLQHYLIRKSQGETEAAFKERCALADYTNHFATVVDSLAGMLAAVESDANRMFTDENGRGGLGDHKDPSTPMGRLWRDVDGEGMDYLTFWKVLSVELIVGHLSWIMVDTDADGNAHLRLFPAPSVVNWRWSSLGVKVLEEVLVEEEFDVRESLQQEPKTEKRYTLFQVGQWERFRVTEDGVVESTGELGTYEYTDRNGNPALPIFPVGLPLQRPVGWTLAKKSNAIFNKESERDHLLRHANFPRLILSAGDDLYTKLVDGLAKGSNVMQEDPTDAGKGHRYINPDSTSADIATKILERKVDEFYVTAFREYGDAARERTATEVRQDVSSGVGAFLQLLKAALDEAENGALWRLEQTENPANTDFICAVERSDDFVTSDINMVIERLRERYFGKEETVPIGREGRIKAAMQIAEWDGLQVTEDDIKAAVDTQLLQKTAELTSFLPIPAEALAQMTVQYLIQSGQLDPKAVVPMADGNSYNLVDLVLTQARYLADAKQTATLREAESFPGSDYADDDEE